MMKGYKASRFKDCLTHCSPTAHFKRDLSINVWRSESHHPGLNTRADCVHSEKGVKLQCTVLGMFFNTSHPQQLLC